MQTEQPKCNENTFYGHSLPSTFQCVLLLVVKQLTLEKCCPLSSSLFIICIEYLSHFIQSNNHIKGISLEPDEEIKQSLFAYDPTYFLNDSGGSFNNLIESLNLFGIASGLKLNKLNAQCYE
ncbi:hypothetical protein DPMN_177450 [Dreissena polymorpha]|uniref:Uncharacterized protein n=1 Tax=Dreissena polymorpha TaxID=45954 RepID=A0A9D4EB21_DREPO|nr:hypothetical protein DPMN_177450 [Dreissena polymorpha]